jgi:hypothetical protein
MATYVLSYRNPKGYVPTADTREQWWAWFRGMGDALVDIGQPVATRSSLGDCDSDRTELGGYSLINAPDLDSALIIAHGCPHLHHDGGVEVGELVTLHDAVRLDSGSS